MRKVLNVITLIVMLGVNIMNPFTYAISSGDDFEEIQNVDEAMQEDGDFSDEENIENSENEEDSENVENNEDLEEQEEENTENDEISNEEDEGDNEKDEEIEKENKEEQEENIDKTENTTENQDEENIDKIEEDSGEQENSEKQTENNGSAIDLLKDVVEGSGNILTGEIETLSGDIVEFTGEVEELTGKELELSIARETLNIDPIIGTENTKGVTVNVEAQSGTFPQGTELRIKPITLKKELNEIKEQIIDSQENVSEESELVAFDISFIYVLSGGEEVELQPKNYDGVKVIFNYENNENLSEADENDEQEVKVFHLDDKDENGEKVAQGEEIVKDVTNRVESEEAGIAVANAESFSIYAIVTVSGSIEGNITIIHNLRGGYWIEDGSFESKSIEYSDSDNDGIYTAETGLKTPSKTGYMFMGWFDEDGNTRWIGENATDGMEIFAKWLEFGDLDVYILSNDTNTNKYHYTLMDRNMGAESQNAIGYYYQWGNNFGFTPGWGKTETGKRGTSGYSWNHPYVNSIFYLNGNTNDGNWINSKNPDLWGGNESDVTHRQGPCPDGYHVPTITDWDGVISKWKNNNTRTYSDFYKDFLVVGAGYLARGTANRATGDEYSKLRYATSSLNNNGLNAKIVKIFGSDGINSEPKTNVEERTANGMSVRCFKNSINSSGEALDLLDIHLDGGVKAMLSIASGVVVAMQNPTKSGRIFEGWYTNDSYEGDAIETGDMVPAGSHLYAKWECQEGYVLDGGVCVKGFKITFNATKNGGITTSESMLVTGGITSKTIDLSNYTAEKTGFYFVGWNTGSDARRGRKGEKTFTESTKLYAIFLDLNTYTFEDEEGNILGTGYYESGEVSDMSKLLTFDYYSDETGDISHYADLLTLGLDDPSKGWKWTPSLPEDGIATGNLILHGEKVNKYTVTFNNDDGTDFLAYDVIDGTIIKEPVNHPEKVGYSFLGWYEDAELQTKFDFSSKVITQNTIIYPAFKEILCTFKLGEYGAGISINGFSGTQTEDCLTHFVIPSEIEGKPVLRIGEKAFDGTLANAQIISGEIVLPDTLTSIGNSAFYKNNISGTLRIPGGVTTVSNYTFRCNLIEEVIFGEGITTINQDAFNTNNCTDKKTIKKVTFPSTLTSIGKDAFNSQLIEGELELPESLTSIGDSVFYNNNISGILRIPGGVTTVTTAFKCNPVEEVIFGEGITTINQDAFRTNNCTTKKTIKKVTFPSTLTTIRNLVFDGQIIEGELELPESLTSIGDGAFYNNNISGILRIPGGVTTVTTAFKCNPVEEVIFGEGITTINSEAFRTNNCTTKKTIKKVTFPSTLTTIRHMVFDGQIIEGELIIPDSVQTIGNSAFNSNLITGLILGNSVQTIGNSAFNNNKLVGELIIPNSVQTIGNYAFDGNNNGGNKIEGELLIPDSVQTIGEFAFRNNLITGLTLGNNVQTISKYAFDRNKIGGEVIIPDSVYTIGEGAFNGNQITRLTLGNSLESIGVNAFLNNKIESELIIPDSVQTIGGGAFKNNNISGILLIPGRINNGVVNDAFRCNTMEEVIFGEGIISIDDSAFNTNDCKTKSTIKSVNFPDSLTTIGNQTFLNQSIEGEFEFTPGLTNLGAGAFKGNKISGTLTVPGRLNGGRLNGAFKCNLIENLIIEEGITVVGDQAFYDGTNDGKCPGKYTIKNVQFPSTLVEIQYNAFRDHQLSSLKLPENVEIIQNNAFDNQHDASGYTLKSVELNDKLQQIQTRAFATNDIKSVYIPDSVEFLSGEAFDQLSANIGTYVTGYVTTKKSTLDYTGAYIKPLYQLYTYTFVNEDGDILGTGYYPEIFESNTTKLIPLDYYNGIGNINDFTGADELITSPEGYKVVWSTPLSESSVVTDSLVVTGSIEKVHTVVFKNPFTGDIVEYILNNQYISEPEEFVVQGYTFTGWYSGDVKVEFPLQVTSDLILTGRYDISKYTVNFYEDEEQTTPLTGGAFDYNTVLDVENPQKAGRAFGGWYYLSGSEEVFVKLPVVVDKDMDLYAKWGNPVSIVFDANGGKFSDDSTQKTIVYAEDGVCGGSTTYSHTSNVNDNGEKISNEYGNYQNRTDVVTIPGAKKLKVTITYQTEAINYDRACVREGSHPEYSGSVDCTRRLGGTTTGTKEYIITGDTVTFGFKSDYNKNNYYGYYAIVTDVADYYTPIVEEPSREGGQFDGWYLDQSGNNPFVMSCTNKDKTVYAKWRGYTGWDGCYEYSTLLSTGTEYIAEIINYSGGDSCVKENLSITDKIVRNGREYTIIEISDSAFENKGLSGSLTLPSTIKYVDYKAFSGNQITSLNLNEGLININSAAFANNNILNIIIPNSVEFISAGAFAYNTNLKNITLGSGVKYLNNGVFGGSTDNLESINFGEVEYIYESFQNTKIDSLEIPDSVKYITNGAFYNNQYLKSVIIGDGLETLSEGLFGTNENLESVIIGNGVKYINSAFANCIKLKDITRGDNIETINGGAFYNTAIENLVIPDTVTTINGGAFQNNSKLKTVKIGTGLKNLNAGVFDGSTGIENVDLGKLETIGAGNFSGTQLTGLVIPDTVTKIYSYSFVNNTKLRTVTFGKNVELISDQAFANSAITGVSLPNSLTTLGNSTFCIDDGTNTGTVIGFIGDNPTTSAEDLESQDDTACFVIKNSTYQVNIALTGENMGDFAQDSERSGSKNYGKRIVIKVESRLGYRFWKWEVDGTPVMTGDNEYWTGDLELFVTSGMNITGFFTGDINTYAIHHRKQNIYDDDYSGAYMISQTGYGITDTQTNAVAMDFPGFTGKAFDQTGIKADGSTVVDIFYDRELYTITFDSNEGSPVTGITAKYEKRITKPEDPKRTGYEFSGWYYDSGELCEFPISMPLNGVILIAHWTANTDNEYKVEYYLQNVDLTGYNFHLTGIQYGTSDSHGVADEKIFTGFEFNETYEGNITSGTIVRDGSLVLKLFYDRKAYTISTGSNDESQGSISVEGEPRYGKRIVFRSNAYDSSLYKFVKWELNGHFVTTGENDEFWTGDLVIENLTGDLIVTGHFAAYSGCSWSGGEIAHGTSVTGYLTPTVPYGETCVSEIRTCNDGTLSGTYEYASCTPEGASSCDLPWGGTVPDGTSVTGYKTSSEKCPDECESVIAICNNGNWNVENFTGIYTEPSCVTQPVSREGYDLDECPEHGICSSITGYTVSENVCIKGEEKYRLDSCEVHYHTGSDNKSCEIDRFDIVWKYRDEKGERTGNTINVEYGKNPTQPSYPTIIQTAQTGYTFSGWTPEVSSPVTTGAEYTAQYNETTREYLITFLDGDGEIIQTGMVAYGATPAYTGEIPTKTATAQYSYSFNNTWEPEIVPVTTGAEYTAQFDSILNKYTVTINVNTNSGSVSTGSVTENWGSLITENGNELTIGDTTVIATAKTGDAQYIHGFSRWNNTCGDKVETGCSIEAEFTSTIREYTITFHSNGGSVVTGQTKQYGSHVDEPADPTRQGYGFSGWYSNISLTQKYNFTETVTGDLDLYAKWTPITYTIGYELNGGILPAGQENPTTYTIESNDITLKNPTRIGYIFSGWTGTDLSTESTEVTIASGSMGDRVYYANWQPDNVNVTVYYFTQKLNPSTNELIDEFDTHDIKIVQMQSDLEFNIYDEFYEPIEGFEYVRATVTEQDTSEHTETTTTVLPNGSRVINLYYTRGQYNFAIIPVDNVTTQGSSENSGYYYGATITLSGSSSNDCFMWSGWTNLPEGTINNSQTSFTMPANAISLSGVVTEKTYNISFNGNGADEGEMETLNGISCTQSIYLPINKFKKVGHTFTGWTTTIDGSKEYNDGARIQALTTGNNITVNLIAVWDINKYDIVWKNYNGETLDSQILEYGVIPEYGGEYPLRDPDIQFSYSFSGWTPEIQRVEGPQVYTAVYSTTLNEYTITWDVDGTITTETYEYGAIPYFSGSKGKVPDKQYIYTFSGWNPQISPVSGNITYTATYTATLRKYTVTWINSNGDVLEIDENVPYGTTPTYDGPTPTKEGDTEHHYTFAGWAPAVGPISGDTTYEAIFDSTKKEYTIIWQNENGGILETDEDVPYGTMPSYDGPTPTKASDAQYSYEFAGWTPETGAVVGHQTYTATYTAIPRKYTVTWKNSNGSVIRTDTGVEYGTTLEYQGPTPTSGGNAQYSYEFTGWNPAIGEIHGDTTYTAVYTHKTNKYTITWKNRDGTVIKTVTGVEYGATPIYGDVSPTKTGDAQYSYEFIGWDPGISTVTGDTSYTAKFKENLNRYKVIFINDDSGILKEATEYDYGTSRNDIEKPADPTKASDVQYSYEFAGWDPSISVLTGDITFKATYTSTVNKYTVTWKNRNGSIIKTNTGVEYGTEPEYDGPTPTKESTSEYSYRFTGWEPAIGEIHGDTTYTAQFEPILESYTITWKDRDGKVLKVDENVPYGVTPVYSGDNPSRSGNIQYDYIFDGWTPSLVPVHGDATYTAKYRSELKKYKVIWKNWDDEVLETDENVLYGSTPKYDGEEPTKPGSPQYSYVFDRWTPNIHAVDGDVVYKAVFEELINKYTVTWENWDESVIKTDTGVEYGTVLEYDGPTPTKEGDAQYSYEFSGWDNEIKAIHEDTTYRATYIQSVNEYLITFLDGDGKTIQTGMVAYGDTPSYTGSTPTKAKTQEYTYTFNNTWSPEIHSVGGEETYTAQFNSTKNKYTITINANTNSGSINTGLITAEYGTPITESGNELKIGDTTVIATAKPSDAQYTHEFSGWNNTCGLTLNDGCTIEAEFRSIVNKYLITFLDGDGKTIQTGMVAYGATPNYTGSTPTKTKTQEYTYTFNGNWSPAIHSVTTGETYTAQFNSTKNKYTITINANTNSGSINTGLITAEYGTSITESGNELKIGDTTIIATAKPSDAQYTHEFSGWNNTCGLTLNDGCIIEAEFRSIIHKYTVIWNNEDGMQLEKDENVPYGTMPQYNGTTPVKPGDGSGAYVFDGWNPNPTIVVGNVEYTAKYKEKTSPQDDNTGNRRSGGGRKHTTSQEIDQHGSAEDIDNPSNPEKEVFDAYKRAYKYGITTIDNEQKADPNGYVTRGHLAKMVVNFTVNVLGRDMPVDTPTKCKRNDDDSEWKSSEIKFYAEKSCALGVMGLYTKKFMPNKIVDRAEFGTVVSRILWGDKYNELDTRHHLYFTKHLKALHENGFMKDIDNPLGRKEFRKRVWLVLKRIELEKNMK